MHKKIPTLLPLFLFVATASLFNGRVFAAPQCIAASTCPKGQVPVGPVGPRGPVGPAGATGATGPAGPASCTGEGCLVAPIYTVPGVEQEFLCNLAGFRCDADATIARPSCDPGDVEINSRITRAGLIGVSGIVTIDGVPTVVAITDGYIAGGNDSWRPALVRIQAICVDTSLPAHGL